MKKLFWIAFLTLSAAAAVSLYPMDREAGPRPGASGASMPQGFGASLDIGYCYDYLAPFGSWIRLDPWGYVWCPRHMGYRWRPYSHGRWVWTDWGWTWISAYEWGWMPFHYGRWGWDDYCGWYWVPGSTWGPAWVSWRWSDLYIGWAPMPPGFNYRPGISLDVLSVGIPHNFWVFIGGRRFLERSVHGYVLPYERNMTIISSTRLRNDLDLREGRLVNRGIGVEPVQRMTRRPVVRHRLADDDRPGEGRAAGTDVRIYRPMFKDNPAARPKAFLSADEARRELGPARIFEPDRKARAVAPESAVRKRQAEERTLLEKSQLQERKAIERRVKEESRAAAGQAEKEKVRRDEQARMAEQRKQHQEERQKIAERHRKDNEEVRRSAPPKKESPPPPRKKK